MDTPDNKPPSLPLLKQKKERTLLDIVWNVFLAMVLIAVVAAVAIPQEFGSRRVAWMNRAKGTLRSIGNSEESYRTNSRTACYGSFEALMKNGDIAERYTKGNMIENYTLTWNAQTLSTAQGEISKFTVIAWPWDTRPGFLMTFGITEDGKVREYNPKKRGIQLNNVKSWDPIL